MAIASIKPLFTAHATSTGGRNGDSRADDGSVSVHLSVPKEMGGPGKPETTTPEHLFATGYAACFGGALDYVAKQHKKNATGATTRCAVTIGPRDAGGFGLAVRLDVTDMSLPQAELQAFVNEAHENICPYSHATRGNIDVQVVAHGARGGIAQDHRLTQGQPAADWAPASTAGEILKRAGLVCGRRLRRRASPSFLFWGAGCSSNQ